MANKRIITASAISLGIFLGNLHAAEVTLGPDLKIPPYYKAANNRCLPGRGYLLTAAAPNYPPTEFPRMNLRVFNGEVIGFMFEVDAKEGWRPWYDQPEGKPTTHEGRSLPHYQQTIYIKKGPTAEECKASKGPDGQ